MKNPLKNPRIKTGAATALYVAALTILATILGCAAARAQTAMPGGEKRQKALEFEDSTVEGLNRDRADLNTMSKSWKDRRKNHLYQAQKENFFKDASKATMRELRYSQ